MLGRVRLSAHFFMREFLYSEISAFHGLPNLPDDPDLAIAAGTRLCEELLEPLRATFGHVTVRSGYRSPTVNGFGNRMQRRGKAGYSCARNETDRAYHIWDQRDSHGRMGAAVTVQIPWFADQYELGLDWRCLAWWIHDHLPYNAMFFFPIRAGFNLQWREDSERRIDSYIAPRGCLTKPGMANHGGDHSEWYRDFPPFLPA